MDLFLSKLPKIELHAHLNGSLDINGIKLLGQKLYGENSPEFIKLCEKFIDFKTADLDCCFQKFAFMHELTATPKGLQLEESNEMIEFGFQRCGHGTFLTTEQLRKCADKHITIECCLTSNIKCGTVKSYENHHFGKLFKSGIPSVLCTDDCGVFDTTLTEEFSYACKYFNLNRDDICRLSLNAIEASFADQNEKNCLKGTIKAYFETN